MRKPADAAQPADDVEQGRGALDVAIAGVVAYGATHQSSGITVVTETVKRGDIHQTVEVTGDTQSVQNLDLAFSTSGTVAVMNVSVGDAVHAGDILSVLSSAKISANLSQAASAVDQAQAALDLKSAGSTTEDIAISSASVVSAQAALDAAKSALEQALLQATQTQNTGDISVSAAEDDVTQADSSTAATIIYAQDDESEAIRSLVANIRSALSKADAILGIENNLVNIDFDQDLGIKDPHSVSDAHDAFIIAATARDIAESSMTAADVQTAYDATYTTLINVSRVLDATTGGSSTLSLDDLQTLKTSISSAASSLTSSGSAFSGAKQSLETATRLAIDDVTNANNALAKAKAAQDANNASATAQIASATSTVALRTSDLTSAQAQLTKTSAAPRAIDLAGLEAAVAIAKAQYASAAANAADAEIIAPINGIVTAVNADIGELAQSGSTLITLLGTADQFEIVMDIPEADIAKVHVGQQSVMTFDALGEDDVFSGKVYRINPAEKLIEGVVFYEAKVVLDVASDISAIKPGMSANVTINTANVTNALFIPKRAILEDTEGKYVRIPKDTNGNYDRRSVTVGLYGDDGSAEILSGLNENETVIVTIR